MVKVAKTQKSRILQAFFSTATFITPNAMKSISFRRFLFKPCSDVQLVQYSSIGVKVCEIDRR